jgi:hypothetical protein
LKSTREYKTGFFAAFILLIIFGGVILLKTVINGHQRKTYFMATDHIEGIHVGDKVLLNGEKIGFIDEYRLLPSCSGAIVKLLINKNVYFPKGMAITFDTTSSYKHGRVGLKLQDSTLLTQKAMKKQIDQALMILDTMEQQLEQEKMPTEIEPLMVNSDHDSGVSFQVQIGAFSVKKPLTLFSRPDGIIVHEHHEDGYYKYTLGDMRSVEEATAFQHQLLDEDYKGAFIVAYKSGIRISLYPDINIRK